ncbi:hypothetical protein J3E72DRAFT_363971 [Bipolaris maydis]|uniref:uncharacterized protein n=1 Tax=Cochliobolus heterostrophus TaxID=5016 RepID=UPI0024D9D6B5|nr:hypothetical protein J3E73DRAFT_284522 [Bipolaris maydis]KAJ6192753.1 hypothetical protein J3E72DRAFT_363971 [Bipolaris maydis]KAJ6214884.1 hypothetical protein PSV09DRAFT_2269725 [Bipolaris maydis]KAJ6276032.1 hypothetical protein PSV08DRAFT_258948 [Bipolaris maydis]
MQKKTIQPTCPLFFFLPGWLIVLHFSGFYRGIFPEGRIRYPLVLVIFIEGDVRIVAVVSCIVVSTLGQ